MNGTQFVPCSSGTGLGPGIVFGGGLSDYDQFNRYQQQSRYEYSDYNMEWRYAKGDWELPKEKPTLLQSLRTEIKEWCGGVLDA